MKTRIQPRPGRRWEASWTNRLGSAKRERRDVEMLCGYSGARHVGTWMFWWGDGRHEDHGIQVARARPLPTETGGFKIIPPAEFVVTRQGMKIELDGGYTYSVTVTNNGPWECPYEIIGDGI